VNTKYICHEMMVCWL